MQKKASGYWNEANFSSTKPSKSSLVAKKKEQKFFFLSSVNVVARNKIKFFPSTSFKIMHHIAITAIRI